MSRYQTFRRIAAPAAIVFAGWLLVKTSCDQKDREPVRFWLDLGDHADRVAHVHVDLWDGDASAGFFDADLRDAAALDHATWSQVVTSADLSATIEMTDKDGTIETVRRAVHADPGSSVTIRVQ